MKISSIKTQLLRVLIFVDALMFGLIVLSGLAMRDIRDEALESMSRAIEVVETSENNQLEQADALSEFINPEMNTLNRLAGKYILIGIIGSLVCGGILTFYIFRVSRGIVSDLERLEEFANQLSKGKLVTRIEPGRERGAEIGRLNMAFTRMIEWYDETIGFVKNNSERINTNVNDMSGSIGILNQNIESVAATAEELSATMQEMAASVTNIVETVDDIEAASKDVADRSQDGAELAIEIKDRASEARRKMTEKQKQLELVHGEISQGLTAALDQIQIVNEIGRLSESIMDITTQTTLLSLNASIEAARAGEAGRGFAVVATEIQKLAEESRQSVADIQHIIASVSQAAEGLSDNARQLLSFVSEDVRDSFTDFMNMAIEYNRDADNINAIVMEYSSISQELTASIESVTTEINRISNATSECAQAACDIAQMNTNIEVMSGNTRTAVENTNTITNELQKVVSEFVISV